jgi:hypothetical protein
MPETGAEQCPNCGTLNEFGLPSEDAQVERVISANNSNHGDKVIKCYECNVRIGIFFN